MSRNPDEPPFAPSVRACVRRIQVLAGVLAFPISLTSIASLRASERWLDRLNPGIAALDRERRTVEQDLAALGTPSVGQTVPEYGYQHPLLDTQPATPAWVQIDLDESPAVDTIVLIPALPSWQSYAGATRGFPVRWRIDFAEDAEFTRTVPLADFTAADYPEPGSDPVILRVPAGASRRYLRLTVTRMAVENNRYFFALAEIMALSGNLNVAVRRPIRDSAGVARPRAWQLSHLVDGRTPLGPPVRAEQVLREGFRVWPEKDTLPEFVVDLGRPFALQQLRLHPIQARGPVNTPGVAFPTGFRVEVAQSADFSDVRVLQKYEQFSNPGDNPVTISLRRVRARYVRIAVTAMDRNSAGFSEIEIYADGRNVARGGVVTATPDMASRPPRWPEALLNDGLASYGRLIELPEWLHEWERRRELKAALGRIGEQRLAAAAVAVRRAIWIGSGGLVLGLAAVGGLLLASRHKRQRELAELRARLARDLHDEIGSNLAGLVVLSQVARAEEPSSSPQQENWTEVQRIARDSVAAMREVLWLVGGRDEAGADLLSHLRLAASRILAGREVRWTCTVESLPATWPMDDRRHVFLFFKEALANIVRHSQATRIDISARLENAAFILEIADNGHGFDPARVTSGLGLASQRERAAVLKARFLLEASPGHGVRLQLTVPLPAAPSAFSLSRKLPAPTS